ncbi:MAG: SRPBCC domain-containing protein [Prevotella sp.]|nr:SRPBCC domain-containing protein [Prevotella sp.]
MQKLTIEYPLSTQSPKIVWDFISNAHGLQKWLADKVIEEDENILTFTWGHPWTERDTKQSRVLDIEKYDHIRLLWDYHEKTPEAYWEMRIEKSELTGHLNLVITDYAVDDDEAEDLRELWDANLERLHSVSGL